MESGSIVMGMCPNRLCYHSQPSALRLVIISGPDVLENNVASDHPNRGLIAFTAHIVSAAGGFDKLIPITRALAIDEDSTNTTSHIHTTHTLTTSMECFSRDPTGYSCNHVSLRSGAAGVGYCQVLTEHLSRCCTSKNVTGEA